MNTFDQTLLKYGATLETRRLFDDDSADLLPYATLVGARQSEGSDLTALRGVVEWQDSPLVFLVDGESLRDNQHLQAIRRRLAMRGDAPYLGVVWLGRLDIYRIGLDSKVPRRSLIDLDIPPGQEKTTFAYLGNNRPGISTRNRWISEVVLKLLNESITELIVGSKVTPEDAISLVGRALFTRFLGDRNLLAADLIAGDIRRAESLFDSPEELEKTCRWLDKTFNGDLLPIRSDVIKQLPERALQALGNILRHASGGQRHLAWKEDWAHLDFAHIPVGVLSQAYEHYLREHSPERQKKEGGFYTPHLIANLMVRGAFHALRSDGIAHQAKVLDPAVGAGVFLLTAFRELVAERWRRDDKRPQTATLREILYTQLQGFDINEAALRFAALGLYLLSIELDPHPEPVEKLGFENLRGKVLLKISHKDNLGSLGAGVGDQHIGAYDLVIGNPPWSSAAKLDDWKDVKHRVATIAKSRLLDENPPPVLPNEVMDLPFVWRAMEWAKPGAQITFALHARFLFQQGERMPEARGAIFSALDITSVINGAELRNTKVWPGIAAPFCLLFARNQTPRNESGFRFITPHFEEDLNGAGGLRFDVSNADIVTPEEVVQRPEILKILFRGGPLDLDIFDRMSKLGIGSLSDYWKGCFGVQKGKLRFAGNGYQKLRKSSRTRKEGDAKPGVSADYLAGFPELKAGENLPILLDRAKLEKFEQTRIHDPRSRDIFQAPLLLVHQSPPAQSGRIRVTVSEFDVVFSESYYGYSAQQHPDGHRLVRYMALVIGSRPAFWHTLITSGKFGFEREVVEKIIVEGICLPSFDELSPVSLEKIDTLFDALIECESEENWSKVDEWVAQLYGLRPKDLSVIEDTLRYKLPFAENREAAYQPPGSDQKKLFLETLKAELEPWAQRFSADLQVRFVCLPAASPWGVLQIYVDSGLAIPTNNDWPKVLHIADQLASTEVLYYESDACCLWIARLSQARYWSVSQARLLAQNIIWEYLEQLLEKGKA